MTLPISGECTVGDTLRFWAESSPDAPFLIFDPVDDGPRRYTYAEFLEMAMRTVGLMTSLGLACGDRFAVVLDNSPEFLACWFGAAIAGTVMVPVNPNSTVDDLRYVFDHAQCRAVICGANQRRNVESAWCGPASRVITAHHGFADLSAPAPSSYAPQIAGCDPLAVLYTSGTTSRPKGVVVTHANYLAAGSTVAGQLRMRTDDRWLVVLPLFHANAQYYCVMSALVTGASVAVTARFSASRWGAQVRNLGATLASLFAAPIRMVLATPESGEDADNGLRATVFAQNITRAQLMTFQNRFDCPLLQLYGMTETIAPPLMNPLYGPSDSMSIGLPTEPGRVRVVDEDGHDVAPGEIGELLIGGIPGQTLMAGYLADDATTGQAITDGWLHTGDIVRQRSDGFLVFHDRAKNMIKRAGENVAAAEVERVIDSHPGVHESAVIGVPDEMRDEAIKAFVVPNKPGLDSLDEDELIEFCSHRLPRGKVPDQVEIVVQLPYTAVGKIRKDLLLNHGGAAHHVRRSPVAGG
ncbi:AMP-binding protein [Mycobacterium sherrisii]|uniref:AMP-binding protein n=1 Tax=Mycobacterium sherrisii TaxID=243061 RepID=UPI002DDCDE4D|nr:AMP-binding protein [Mycobacterium sherrisii]MEC4763471.1 AMP-binding protein [Mycobacterium sherrisii]